MLAAAGSASRLSEYSGKGAAVATTVAKTIEMLNKILIILLQSFQRVISSLQFFTSTRRALDQVPVLPEASLARTRHHICKVGSVLVLNLEQSPSAEEQKARGTNYCRRFESCSSPRRPRHSSRRQCLLPEQNAGQLLIVCRGMSMFLECQCQTEVKYPYSRRPAGDHREGGR